MSITSEDRFRKGGGAKRKAKAKPAEERADLDVDDLMEEATLRKSQQRAKTTVRRKLLTFQADRMLTLTFRDNVTDVNDAWTCFKYFSKLMRWRFGEKWVYVSVPERQKRGAIHFHLAIRGFYHANTVRRLWLRAVGHRGGNVDITSPKQHGKNSWNPRRIAQYLTKYLTKQETVAFNKRRYSSGGDIVIPEPRIGWLAYGLPMHLVLRDILYSISRKTPQTEWEAKGYFDVIYAST